MTREIFHISKELKKNNSRGEKTQDIHDYSKTIKNIFDNTCIIGDNFHTSKELGKLGGEKKTGYL